jgi:hypothetical protein
MSRNLLKPLLVITTLLLLIFASRALQINRMQFHQDEARSAMRMFGKPAQIIAWQPPDWPALHNILLGFWQTFVGPLPFALRSLSVFMFLLGAAMTYRTARRLFHSEIVAWVTTLVYSALGYTVFLSTFVRAYVMAMALFSLALWLTMRYFYRPSWRRALLLGVTMAGMFYATYTAAFAFIILGLFTLCTMPRMIWRWWKPGATALLLVLPELIAKQDFFTGRVASAASIFPELDPLPEAMLKLYRDYVGQQYEIWLIIGVVALLLFLTARRLPRSQIAWVLMSIVLGLLGLYVLAVIPIVYFFEARYTWWVFLMIALGIGYGLARLPRPALIGIGAVLLVLMFSIPVNARYKPDHHRPFEENFRWLQRHIERGDVMLIDPNFCLKACNEADSWAYYFDVYLRDHIEVVTEPGDHRRIWYVQADGWHDAATKQAVMNGRIPSIFVGPWDFLIRLYEGPPDPEGVPFENGLRFAGFDVLDGDHLQLAPFDWYEQTRVRVRLWWSVDHKVDADYSISLQVIDTNRNKLIAQQDSGPQVINLNPVDESTLPQATSQWEPGRYYVEEREITLPNLGSEINAELMLTVYQWWDGERVAAPGVNPDKLLPLTRLIIWGWG